MNEGLRTRFPPAVGPDESGSTAPRVGPALTAVAAVVGSIGPLGFVLGRSPVVLATEHRPAASLVIVAIAGLTAAVTTRSTPSQLLAAIPALAVAGAVTTWSTSGRVQGIWCVAATAAASALIRAVRTAAPSPTRSTVGTVTVSGVVAAGVSWALGGPGVTPALLVAASTALGIVVVRDAQIVRTGDHLFGVVADGRRRLAERALSDLRASPRRVARWWTESAVRPSMAISGLVAAALTAPIFHRLAASETNLVTGFNDFRSHLDFADGLGWDPLRITVPHPLFHVFVRLLENLVSEPLAATIVLSGAVGLTVASLTWIATLPFAGRPGLSPTVAPWFALAWVFAESPTAALQSAGLLGQDGRYALLHVWASPTETVLLPFVFLLVVKVAQLLDEDRPDRRLLLVTAVLSVSAALAKPALTISLVPAAVVLGAVLWARRETSIAALRGVIGAVALPSAAIVAWQTWFLESGGVPQGTSEFRLQPLETLRALRLGREGLWFWSIALLIVVAIWIGGRRFFADRSVQVTAVNLGCSLAILTLVHEAGVRENDGNLAKPALFAWLLFATWCLRLLWVSLAARWSDRRQGDCTPAWVMVSTAVVAILLVGGVAAWLDAVGLVSMSGWGVAG